MKPFTNQRKNDFLNNLASRPSLFDVNNDLTLRCKFNFSYFDSSQIAGQNFIDWKHKQLHELLDKIREYTQKSLEYWKNERVGKGGLKVLSIYGGFPVKSDFTEPKSVPHQAQWGRFRLGSKLRLIGFTIPTELHKKAHATTGEYYDKNTFYVVFLDRDHKFYLSENH